MSETNRVVRGVPDDGAPAVADREEAGAGLVLHRLWGYARPFAPVLVLAGLAALATAALSIAVPAIIRLALDGITLRGEVWLWRAAGFIVLAGLLEGVTGFGSRYLMESVGFRVVYQLRAMLFRRLHELSFEFHDNARIGDIMARLTADTEALSRLFGFALPYIAANSLTIVGMAAVLLAWNARLGVSFLLLLPLMVRAMRGFAFQVQPAFRRSQQQLGRMSEVLRIALLHIRETRLFGQEEHERSRFGKQSRQYRDVNLDVARTSAHWMPQVDFLVGLTTALALAVGGIEVIGGRATPGTLVAFLIYAGMLVRPIRQTGMLTAAVVRGAAAGGRVLEVIDQVSPVQESLNAYDLPTPVGRLTLENVCFQYRAGVPVLDGIDLEVAPGEVIALVGPTGAGKTTLVHLIPRFYDPTAGRVLIDGHDVRDLTLSSLRRRVGTALQNIFLFNGTVRDNIAFGQPEAPFSDVRRAAELAQIHEEIEQLPRGYDTPLGERGVALSGGQRQRLALARVLLTDPRILILDEISSELDAVTESRLRVALMQALEGRTTIVIAHRLWTVRQADRIVVLDAGRVDDQGTHRELMDRGGLYRDIYSAMAGPEDGREAP